jgi:beta-N-acetylhexosaminidase
MLYDLIGIATALPTINAKTAERLERALAGTRVGAPESDRAALVAKRDTLLALA